jgi:predicted oxidoreductase
MREYVLRQGPAQDSPEATMARKSLEKIYDEMGSRINAADAARPELYKGMGVAAAGLGGTGLAGYGAYRALRGNPNQQPQE